MEAVHKVSRRKGPKQSKATPESTQSSKPSPMKCNRCGQFPGHARTKCPAKEAKCLRCKKRGHYKAMCRSGGADVNVLDDSDHGDTFLSVISSPKINSIGTDQLMALKSCLK